MAARIDILPSSSGRRAFIALRPPLDNPAIHSGGLKMKRALTLSLLVSLIATAAFALDGAWTASVDEKDRDHIQFNLTTGHWNNMGMTLPVAAFMPPTRRRRWRDCRRRRRSRW